MNLEGFTLSKIRFSKKGQLWYVSFMWNFFKKSNHKNIVERWLSRAEDGKWGDVVQGINLVIR